MTLTLALVLGVAVGILLGLLGGGLYFLINHPSMDEPADAPPNPESTVTLIPWFDFNTQRAGVSLRW